MKNREFKFRIWNPETCSFYTLSEIIEDDNYSVDFEDLSIRFRWYGGERGELREGVDCVIQQYTGLKDKNNKPIYEGDILLYKLGYQESMGGQLDNEIFEVEWNSGAFVAQDDYLCQSDASEYEIIGDIFKNPGLLK